MWQQDRSSPRAFVDQRADTDAFSETVALPAEANIESAPGASVPALWVRMPAAADVAVVIWLHGDGYAIGSRVATAAWVSI
jgi:hypothetical protein